jgi:MFS family permease
VTVLLLIWIGWRRRARFGAVSTVVAAIVGSSALVWLGQFLVGLFRSGQWWRGHPEIISLALGASALLACAVALVVSRKVTKERLRSAFWLVFAVLGALACIAAPGAAILIFPPALVAAAGMTSGGKYERMISLAAALLLFLLFAPLLHSIETLLGYGSTWMFASLAALILLPWMVELKPLLADAGRPALAVAGGVALLGWSAAAAAPAYTQDRQQRFSIEYAFDANRGAAKWAVANGQAQLPDSYSAAGPWTTSEVPWSSAPRWTAPAPKLPVETPRVTVLRQREVPGGTFTRPVSAAKGEAKYTIGCSGRSCAGAVFDIVLASRAPVEWLVIATTPGLPTEAKPLVQSRPIFARPQYTPDATISISRVRM